ncbi:hypothetical protein PINS_up015220 [Pythium insidiosum]|nr:hypothetical protein PINS_up015220 [Pythium insidiosum]
MQGSGRSGSTTTAASSSGTGNPIDRLLVQMQRSMGTAWQRVERNVVAWCLPAVVLALDASVKDSIAENPREYGEFLASQVKRSLHWQLRSDATELQERLRAIVAPFRSSNLLAVLRFALAIDTNTNEALQSIAFAPPDDDGNPADQHKEEKNDTTGESLEATLRRVFPTDAQLLHSGVHGLSALADAQLSAPSVSGFHDALDDVLRAEGSSLSIAASQVASSIATKLAALLEPRVRDVVATAIATAKQRRAVTGSVEQQLVFAVQFTLTRLLDAATETDYRDGRRGHQALVTVLHTVVRAWARPWVRTSLLNAMKKRYAALVRDDLAVFLRAAWALRRSSAKEEKQQQAREVTTFPDFRELSPASPVFFLAEKLAEEAEKKDNQEVEEGEYDEEGEEGDDADNNVEEEEEEEEEEGDDNTN